MVKSPQFGGLPRRASLDTRGGRCGAVVQTIGVHEQRKRSTLCTTGKPGPDLPSRAAALKFNRSAALIELPTLFQERPGCGHRTVHVSQLPLDSSPELQTNKRSAIDASLSSQREHERPHDQ